MSKKLLEESTIRSFMKLANLQPLTDKFLRESDDHALEEDSLEEETLEEEVLDEDGLEEGKESEGRPASPKPKVKGVEKAGKMHAAKNAPGNASLKTMKQTHVHSDKPDSIEHTKKSNAPSKDNSTFEIVSEALEEADMEDEAGPPESPEGGEEMGSAGEGGDHQEKMKGLIRSILDNLKDMGSEYGMSMEISDEGGGGESPEGGEEMGPPESPEAGGAEDEAMMQEKLDEMVEKLTKRVASRLIKESKKRR